MCIMITARHMNENAWVCGEEKDYCQSPKENHENTIAKLFSAKSSHLSGVPTIRRALPSSTGVSRLLVS